MIENGDITVPRSGFTTRMTETKCVSKFISSISMNREAFMNDTFCGRNDLMLRDELPLWVTIILGTLYISASIIGTVGNILAITTVIFNKRMQTVGNLLLLNLTISDFLVTCVCMPTVVSYQVFAYPNWPYSETTCKWSKYIVQLSVLCSVISLIGIAVHRYILAYGKVVNLCRTMRFKHFIVLYWLLAIAATIPTALNTELIRVSNSQAVKNLCIEVYATRKDETLHISLRFSIYILTIALLTMIYSFLVVKLRKSEIADHDEERIKERRTAVRLLIAAAVTFMICWLPYVIHFLLAMWPPSEDYELRDGFDIFANFLGLLNSVIDPYLYCYFSKSFRRGFKDVLMNGRYYFMRTGTNRVHAINLNNHDNRIVQTS